MPRHGAARRLIWDGHQCRRGQGTAATLWKSESIHTPHIRCPVASSAHLCLPAEMTTETASPTILLQPRRRSARIEQKLDKLEKKLMAEEGGGRNAKSSTSSSVQETIVTAVVPLEIGSHHIPTGEKMKEEVIE